MKIFRFTFWTVLVVMVGFEAMGQANIIPKLYLTARNTPSGNTNWTITGAVTNNAATDYWKMLLGSTMESPTMAFSSYSNIQIALNISSFGAIANNSDDIKIEYFDGSTWTQVGANLHTTSTAGNDTVSLPYTYASAKIRITAPNATATAGARVTWVTITGVVSSSNSNASDIISFVGYTYPQNINYASYQSTSVIADGNDIEIAKFTIRDGGGTIDADALGTILTSISMSIGNYSNIRKIALYDAGSKVGTEQTGAATVTFSGLKLTATDNGTKDFSVRVSFNSTVTDNQKILLTVTSTSADIAGSAFAGETAGGAASDNTGNNNKIVVTADRLIFSTNKPPSAVVQRINFCAEAKAVDANGNVDVDQTTLVTLSKATGLGALSSSSGLTHVLASGVYHWTDIQYDQLGSFAITASGSIGAGLSDVTSSGIISQIEYLNENYNYGISDNVDVVNISSWTNHSGTGNPAYSSSGLTYSEYASSGIGGNVTFSKSSGGDINRTFSSITSTSNIFVSFLLNISAAYTNDYFLHLGPSSIGVTFRGKIFARSNGGGWSMSLAKSTDTLKSDVVMNYDQTYLVILKYSLNTFAATDDEVCLWAYDSGVPSSEGSGIPVVTIAPIGGGVSGDPTDIGCVAIRQGTSTPTGSIDGIRIATSWSSSPLPVGLISFTATVTALRSGVELAWKTATEMNNYGFDVQKNVSGIWSKLAFVDGNGTSNVSHSYGYVDGNAAGKVSYRLKQIDRDGKYSYSNEVATIAGGAPTVFALSQNYPNPFNPTTNISFTVPTTGRATLKIFNTIGQEVGTLFDGVVQSGIYNQVQFNGAGLSSGIYISHLDFDGKTQQKKLVLIK